VKIALDPDWRIKGVVREFLSAKISAPVAAARLLFRSEGPARLRELVRAHRLANEIAGRDAERLDELEALLVRHETGAARVQGLIHEHERLLGSARHAGAVETWRRFFDESVRVSEEGSVAAFSLGSAEILEEGTREIVSFLASCGLLAASSSVLEIGCGIGRIAEAVASRVERYHGTEISLNMLAAARRRVPAPNATFSLGSGLALRELRERAFDVVLAVDSFPYVHDAGAEVVDAHFDGASRVLKKRGAFVILNYSYLGEPSAEKVEVACLAADHGFVLEAAGVKPFHVWDGLLYLLRK
jgi:SAM-dependent methyltransferase